MNFRFCMPLLALILSLPAYSCYSQVKSITAQTADSLTITIWIVEQPTSMGKDVQVDYRIENKGVKTVYLVQKENVELEIGSEGIIVNPFTVGFNEHGATDYSFVPIRSGSVRRGKFVVPAQRISRDGVWLIQVGFAFVNNIQGLQPRNLPSRDPAAFRGLLAQRARPIDLGELYLLVK